MTRFLLAMCVAIFSLCAHALVPQTETWRSTDFPGEGSSPSAACAAIIAISFSNWAGHTVTVTGNGQARCDRTDANNTIFIFRSALSCPANSTLSGSACACNSGYEENGSVCMASNAVCEPGQGRVFNRTEGFSRSANADDDDLIAQTSSPPSLYGVNDGVCVGNLLPTVKCYRSQVPNGNGLFRVSCDYTMVVTGSAPAGTGDAAADPLRPEPPCPGFVGEVNGKPVCVGTASSPLPSGSAPPNAPTVPGNPTAGVKPDTGEGSGSTGAGRTPENGSGGNAGGPASAAVGGRGGTGERGEDGEDATAVCGALPLPPCAVKVDETGVPSEGSAAGRFSQGNSDIDAVRSDAGSKITDASNVTLPDWSWTFQLPTGCSPYPMDAFGFSIDVCQFQDVIHDLMTFLWLSAGVFGLLALFRDSTLH